MPIIKDAIENINSVSHSLEEKHLRLTKEINDAFENILTIVQLRRDQVIQELKEKESKKQKTLGKKFIGFDITVSKLHHNSFNSNRKIISASVVL